jgi:hypothetical protein
MSLKAIRRKAKKSVYDFFVMRPKYWLNLDYLKLANLIKGFSGRQSQTKNSQGEQLSTLNTSNKALVLHQYLPSYIAQELVPGGPGFGDFLKGSMALCRLAKKYGLAIDLDLSSHPLSKFLVPNPNQYKLTGDIKEFVQITNSPPDVSGYLRTLQAPGVYPIYTNLYHPYQFNADISRLIVPRVALNSAANQELEARVTKLPAQGYFVIHARIADPQFHSEIDIPKEMSKLIERIPSAMYRKILVVSNNQMLREKLHVRYGLPFSGGATAHMGEEGSSQDALLNTLLDFHLMARSKGIIQFSSYGWGSGFSDACAALFNLPVMHFKIA